MYFSRDIISKINLILPLTHLIYQILFVFVRTAYKILNVTENLIIFSVYNRAKERTLKTFYDFIEFI